MGSVTKRKCNIYVTREEAMRLAYSVYHPPGDKQTNASPVVMLHGMLDCRMTWKYIAPEIARKTGRLVYVVDERNHGDSPWSSEMNWSVLVDDIGDFLKEHNISKAVFVGHSMGGVASFTFALREPQMVEKLIVEDIGARPIQGKSGGFIVEIINLLRESLTTIPDNADEVAAKKAIADYIKMLLPANQIPTFPSFDMEMVPLKRVGNSYRWKANFDAIEQFLTTDKLHHDVTNAGVYNGDSLFLYGTKSFFRVHKDSLIDRLFPRVFKVGFEGATHLIHHEHPKKFEEVVSNFINNGPKPRSKI